MSSFIIKRLTSTLELNKPLKDIKGLVYIPKIKNNDLAIKEIIIVKKEIIDQLILANFNKKYKKIIEYYFNILSNIDDSDNGDTNIILALDEIARLRHIIIKKYQTFLSKKTLEKMLKKLKIMENELRVKLIDYKLIQEQQSIKVSNKGR